MTFGGFQYIGKITGDEAEAALERVADKLEPRIARAFEESLNNLRGRVSEDRLVELIESGDISAIVNEVLGEQVTRDAFQSVSAAIAAAVYSGASAAADIQPSVIGPRGTEIRFVFNQANPRLAEFAQTQTATRVREISEDVRQVTRDVISEGATRGDNPRTTARRVRESIGLTRKQQGSVQNYRRMLETLDRDALERELRDRRFDSSVRRAIARGEPLPQDKIDRMVERYRSRYIKHRSEVIARTESIKSVQGAQHELIQSYIDEGLIEEDQIRRFWRHTKDNRTRDDHRLIASMNPNGVGHNEPFQTPLGPLMYPGDPNGLPENIVNCRCSAFVRVVSRELTQEAA